MSKRKQEIVDSAIELFNESGFYNVSLKEIAKSLKISPGNVTYHFPKKDDLLRTIQEQLIIDANVDVMPKERIDFLHFEKLFKTYFKNQKKYSFYFNNLLFIFKSFPDIAKEYRLVTKKRLADGRKLIDYFVSREWFVKEEKGINYDDYIKTIWMCSIFWMGQEAVLGKGRRSSINSQIDRLWSLSIPYLTDLGKKEYFSIKKEKKSRKQLEIIESNL